MMSKHHLYMTICLIIHEVYCNSKVPTFKRFVVLWFIKTLYFWIEIMHTNDSFLKQHLWYHIFHDSESENNNQVIWKIVVRNNNWGIVLEGGYNICCHDNTIIYRGRQRWLVVENEWTVYASCYLVEWCDVWQQQSITRRQSQ